MDDSLGDLPDLPERLADGDTAHDPDVVAAAAKHPAVRQVHREAVEGDDEVAEAMPTALRAQVDTERPFGRRGRPFGRSAFATGFLGATGALIAITLWRAAGAVASTLLLIVMALFLAVGLNVFVERLQRRGLPRAWAVTVVFLVMIGFFVFAAAALIPAVFTQVSELVSSAPAMLRDIQANPTVARLDERFGIIERAQQVLRGGGVTSSVLGGLVGAGRTLLGAVFKLLTLLILTLYFVTSLESIKRIVYRLVPVGRRPRVVLLGDEILERTGGYIGGALAIAGIAGVSSFAFFEIAGVKYGVSLAIVIAVTDLIPMIGATLGAVIATAFAATQSLGLALASGVFFTVYQQLENYLIYPRVMNRAVDVHPAAAVVAALIGGTLLGFAGALLAIPMAAAIQLVLAEVVFPRQDSVAPASDLAQEVP